MSPRAIGPVINSASAATPGEGFRDMNFGTLSTNARGAFYSPEGNGYYIVINNYSTGLVSYASSLRGPWTQWNLPASLNGTMANTKLNWHDGVYYIGEQVNAAGAALWTATTIGGTWTNIGGSSGTGWRLLCFYNGAYYSSGPSQRMNKITVSGSTRTVSWFGHGDVNRVTMTDGTKLFTADNNGVIRYTTASDVTVGTSFTVIANTNTSFGATGINDLVYDGPPGAKYYVASGDSGKVAYSTTGTTGWTQISNLVSQTGTTNMGNVHYFRDRWFIESQGYAGQMWKSSSSDPSTSTWSVVTSSPVAGLRPVRSSHDGANIFGTAADSGNLNFYFVATR